MTKERLLVVEDEEDILELITYNLIKAGYQVSGMSQGEGVVSSVEQNQPHLILLDIMLPGISGLEICKKLKESEKTKNIPIIFVSAWGEEDDVCKGLDMGADDYIIKPFSLKVLLARVESVLKRRRRVIPERGVSLKVGEFEIFPDRHEVFVGGSRLDLTTTEFKILHSLVRRPGWVFTRYQIVDSVHGSNHVVTDRSVDFQLVGLRKKLGAFGDCIETVRGVGYRFKDI